MAAMFGVSAITISSCKMHYIPPNKAMMPIFESRLFPVKPMGRLNIPEGLFLGTTSSIIGLVDQFNTYFQEMVNVKLHSFLIIYFVSGKLVLVASEKKGLGGAMKFLFSCNGCWQETINYQSSHLALESQHQLVSLALSVAFFISGHGYESYRKTMGRGLGWGVISDKLFLDVIDLAFPHIRDILDEMCEKEKEYMKALSSDQLGSWSCAVTTCNGCWQIQGHFSQNCTFVVKNYLTGGLLYYGHLSMRGADNICEEDLWKGTSKAAEGHLAQVLWAEAKEEGLKVEVNWQDADSSSAKGFRYSFSNEQESRVMLCGGACGEGPWEEAH
ncbi:uncharacterized protein LOC110055892 [Orbicella faveolata]|uniref:uncharacterized protein LOC110055892 n=1 Tax=Orbicella faveolata TaxID=48498 RepID=UPI0009E46267|nr:uncharacterized protein LOC110055892 [Orbicella faveolata]